MLCSPSRARGSLPSEPPGGLPAAPTRQLTESGDWTRVSPLQLGTERSRELVRPVGAVQEEQRGLSENRRRDVGRHGQDCSRTRGNRRLTADRDGYAHPQSIHRRGEFPWTSGVDLRQGPGSECVYGLESDSAVCGYVGGLAYRVVGNPLHGICVSRIRLFPGVTAGRAGMGG